MPESAPAMSATEQEQHRARIAREMNILNRPLNDSDIGWYCNIRDNATRDPYCRWWILDRQRQRTSREWIAERINVPADRISDEQIIAWCDQNFLIRNDLTGGYCHYIKHRDSFDREEIAQRLNVPSVDLTDSMIRDFCRNNIQNGYCVRKGISSEVAQQIRSENEQASLAILTSRVIKTLLATAGIMLLFVIGGVMIVKRRAAHRKEKRSRKRG